MAEYLFNSAAPVGKEDPRRAKDFVKCTDPECWMAKRDEFIVWREMRK